MARVIFVWPKKVVGGNLLFFGAIAGSGEFTVALAKGNELKQCQSKTKRLKGWRKRERVRGKEAMEAYRPLPGQPHLYRRGT